MWSPCPLPCPTPSWSPLLQLPVQLLDSLFVCGRLGSTTKWEIWSPVEDLWDPDPESRTASITVLINPDWPQCRTRDLVGRDRTGLSRWIQGQEGEAGRQRGYLRLAIPHLARPCVHPLALWYVSSPSRYMACANPGGRGHGSSLGKGRVLEDRGRCRLDWVSRGYIYIYKGCRVPGSWPLPEGATLWGPARHAFLPRGRLSIYSPRQAGQGN